MYAKGLALIIGFFLGTIYSPCSFARPYGRDFQAELVVVLNKNPVNPLGGEIWFMGLDGRPIRRITSNNAHEEHPRFSPDGKRIAFVRNMGGVLPGLGLDPKQNEIFIYDLLTGVETRLTHNGVEDNCPEWSYDGKYIAFHSRRKNPGERATLWIMGSDGSYPRQVTQLLSGDLSHTDPVWSPDGSWLAFVNHREESGMRFTRIEKIRKDGTQREVISSGGKYLRSAGIREGHPLGDLDPAFSPDGAMIWGSRRMPGGRVHLFSYGAGVYYGGKAEMDMSWPVAPEGVEHTPQFSPDGRRVVLTRSDRKAGYRTRQLVLTDPQSSFRRHLTSRVDWDVWDPGWYPFAASGADRDAVSTIVAYKAAKPVASQSSPARKSGAASPAQGFHETGGMRSLVSKFQDADPKWNDKARYKIGWKLEMPSERLISLALRFEGKLKGHGAKPGSLLFQLMDWKEKSWVTVFVRPQLSDDTVKVLHEVSPAHFINGDTSQLLLRIVADGVPATSGLGLETEHLRLEVRGDPLR